MIRIVEDGALLPDPFLDITDRVTVGRRARPAGPRLPAGLRRRPPDAVRPLLRPRRRHDDRRRSTRRPAARRVDPATERHPAHVEPAVRQPQRRLDRLRPRPGCCSSPWATAAPAATPRTAPRPRTIAGQAAPDRRPRAPGDEPYAIPADNPFVGPGGRAPRDPPLRPAQPVPRQRRPRDGRPVDRRRGPERLGGGRRRPGRARGLDFGWRRWEGSHCYDPRPGCDPTGVTMPVTEYPHEPGLLGHRRRRLPRRRDPGARGRVPVLRLLHGDAVGDRRRARGAQAPITLLETGRSISSFGIDEEGEV